MQCLDYENTIQRMPLIETLRPIKEVDPARYELSEYILTRVSEIRLNNPRANRGCVILKLHDKYIEDIHYLVDTSIQTLQMLLKNETRGGPMGTAQLTSASSRIGLAVSRIVCHEELKWKDLVRLGDLFIEALFQCKFIDLSYLGIRRSHHIVSITNRWQELELLPEASERIALRGTVFEKPEQTITMFRQVGKNRTPVVKGSIHRGETLDESVWVRALDKLQGTGWRINRRVFETLKLNRNMFVSDVRLRDTDLDKVRISKVIDWSYSIGKAEKLSDCGVFYQFAELDYRGRVYYTESFLNYQGSDIVRGMMKFAKGKPMTESGLFWLAVHTANSYNASYKKNKIPEWCDADYKSFLEEQGLEDISVDKMTLEDRVRWTNENMHWILECGEHPEFKEEAEKSVSFLACCIEWSEYEEATYRGEVFMSRLPIPIDGSNNGEWLAVIKHC